MPQLPHIDRLSFWLGFLAASLVWWLLRSLRRYWPPIKSYIRQQTDLARLRALTSVEERLRKETLRRVQGLHVAAPIFALDEILIVPRLLAPPPQVEPEAPARPEPVVTGLLPYLPDWPETPTAYHYPTLSLAQALEGGCHLAVTGRPGCGKTVALAYLATLMARRDPGAGALADRLPIHLHVNDLDLPLGETSDVLEPILQAVSETAPVIILAQLPNFLRAAFNQDDTALLLDGLDELPPVQVDLVCDYLEKLLKEYPGLRVVTTTSNEYAGRLAGLGFAPIALAAWNTSEQVEFVQRWSEMWERTILPDILLPSQIDVDPLVLNQWLSSGNLGLTPLELTLKAWALYAGDLRGPAVQDACEAYLLRATPDARYRPAMERLALQLLLNAQPTVSVNQANALVAEEIQPGTLTVPLGENGGDAQATPADAEAARQTTIQRALPSLVENGLVSEFTGERVSFAHLWIGAYLASRAAAAGAAAQGLGQQPAWAGKAAVFQHLAAREDLSPWATPWLGAAGGPLYRELFAVARWLREAPAGARWRSPALRHLLGLLQNDGLPLGVRAQALSAFLYSGDASVPILFRQLLSAPSPDVRRMAALGCGLLQDPKSVDVLGAMLLDISISVRQAACLALAAIGTLPAMRLVQDALFSGDEDVRRAAAEALAATPDPGHALLREASASEDLLARRAAVFGLRLIPESWAREILEKMRIEDGQWVVRNAANQAAEDMDLPDRRIPHPLPPPYSSPWLITYASKQGVGIVPGEDTSGMLLQALESGTEEEQLAALDYLRGMPRDPVFAALAELTQHGEGAPREGAFYALWFMALGGAELPATVPLGVE